MTIKSPREYRESVERLRMMAEEVDGPEHKPQLAMIAHQSEELAQHAANPSLWSPKGGG
jgi:hypothetical protein